MARRRWRSASSSGKLRVPKSPRSRVGVVGSASSAGSAASSVASSAEVDSSAVDSTSEASASARGSASGSALGSGAPFPAGDGGGRGKRSPSTPSSFPKSWFSLKGFSTNPAAPCRSIACVWWSFVL